MHYSRIWCVYAQLMAETKAQHLKHNILLRTNFVYVLTSARDPFFYESFNKAVLWLNASFFIRRSNWSKHAYAAIEIKVSKRFNCGRIYFIQPTPQFISKHVWQKRGAYNVRTVRPEFMCVSISTFIMRLRIHTALWKETNLKRITWHL